MADEFQGMPVASEISCKSVIHLICWYLEGKLIPSVAKEVDAHVKLCRDCQVIFYAATMTLDAYFTLEDPTEVSPSISTLSAGPHSPLANR